MALVSYTWLEVAPLAAVVWLVRHELSAAVLFILCHWAFLGLYELGYVWNDRAGTAGERPDRPRVLPRNLILFGAVRVFAPPAAAGLVAGLTGSSVPSAWFLMLAGMVAAFLGAHTILSVRFPGSGLRVVTFGWLAFAKYAPALSAVLPLEAAFAWCAMLFASYGGGRVLEYFMVKQCAPLKDGVLSPNAIWFSASFPMAITVITVGWLPALPAAALLVTLGCHHVAVAAMQALARRAQAPSRSQS